MERREFIQAGAATAISLLSRRPAEAAQSRLSAAEMEQFLQRLDGHREWMARAPIDGILHAVGADATKGQKTERCETLIRTALRSMYLVRSFRELPEHGRAHPGMQRRIAAALPEMDQAVGAARDFLVNLSAADRLDLQRTICADPKLLPSLAFHLSEEAQRAGLAGDGPKQVRSLVEHLDRQLRRSSLSAALDDYVGRADRAAAEAGSIDEMTQRLMNRLGAPAYMTLRQQQEQHLQSWWEQAPPSDYPGSSEVFRMGDEPREEKERIGRERMFRAGAIVLGIGLVPTVLGLVFIPYTFGLSAIAATPGVGMLVTGITLLVVGRRR